MYRGDVNVNLKIINIIKSQDNIGVFNFCICEHSHEHLNVHGRNLLLELLYNYQNT